MANEGNDSRHPLDSVTAEAISISGDYIGNPLNEATLRNFLIENHFDRRTKKITELVRNLNPDSDDNYVYSVYNQLFELREFLARNKDIEDHRNAIVDLRMDEVRKGMEKIVSKGKIPYFGRNTQAVHLNESLLAAIRRSGVDGPLNAEELKLLITGAVTPYILKHEEHQLDQGVPLRTRTRYYAKINMDFPMVMPQDMPVSTDHPERATDVEAIIKQLKQLRTYILSNRKNDKHHYDFISDRLNKAIDGLRTENNYPH